MKKIAILQCSSTLNAATEALDIALALASFDYPVQLILSGEGTNCLLNNPSKRYAMLDLLDAEPIAIASQSRIDTNTLPTTIETVIIPPEQLKQHLSQFDEVLQFS
ncbi:DsrE family protein [Idiomarina sp. HP20-50]|uniref:DsrE family protein n=1 Tax=Idiomarina sp. HP20-50 TaxID=3070813 RepID=UPI00294B2C75|nr:DsrE family protein [Idiomarina sp. HP20-50]MDV6315171.1 DsrE family protein [Idiomarina sp. HP20-50]